MKSKSLPIRGFSDLFPVQAKRYSTVEHIAVDLLTRYGYGEIRLPILEQTELFSRGIGESTDAVGKEMYTFVDRDGDRLSLRPEATASCVRAAINRNVFREGKPKYWYLGAMFRHERPQKGRLRQFQSIGAECFGYPGPDVDVELLSVVTELFDRLELSDHVTLEINTLGNTESRSRYKAALLEFLIPIKDELDDDSQRRLKVNPLRILDSKSSRTQQLLCDAPRLYDYLDAESMDHFDRLRALLDQKGIVFHVNDRLVRGLDYYTHVVFEWNTDELGSQRQLGGGGRYDGLVETLSGPSVPATGFALGIDRIVLLHETLDLPVDLTSADIYVVPLDDDCEAYAGSLADEIRQSTSLRVQNHCGGGRVKTRMRQADRSGARFAVIVGSDEVENDKVTIKWLRESHGQVSADRAEISQVVSTLWSTSGE